MHLASFSKGYQLGLNQGKFKERFLSGLEIWLTFQRFCSDFTLHEQLLQNLGNVLLLSIGSEVDLDGEAQHVMILHEALLYVGSF